EAGPVRETARERHRRVEQLECPERLVVPAQLAPERLTGTARIDPRLRQPRATIERHGQILAPEVRASAAEVENVPRTERVPVEDAHAARASGHDDVAIEQHTHV